MAREVKPFTNYQEQVKLLEERGLIISDKWECIDLLKNLTYYRFSGYLIPFRIEGNKYKPHTTFEQISNICEFDRQIRFFMFQLIEKIELYLRSQISYYCAEEFSPLCYKNKEIYEDKYYQYFQDKFEDATKRYEETPAVKHHINNYNGIPIWLMLELLSFGDLVYFFTDLKRRIQIGIINESFVHDNFKPYYKQFKSWLKCLVALRNRCAHHGRIYNWTFTDTPRMPDGFPYNPEQKLFTQLLVLKFVYPVNNDTWNNTIASKIEGLIDKYKDDIELKHIGFPDNWRELLTYPL